MNNNNDNPKGIIKIQEPYFCPYVKRPTYYIRTSSKSYFSISIKNKNWSKYGKQKR